VILALAVAGLLRVFATSGDPALAFSLSNDSTMFRVDAATYPLLPSCVPAPHGAFYRCVVPMLGDEKQVRHKVTPCKVVGNVTSCGLWQIEANLVCTCDRTSAGGGCPGDLYPEPVAVTPANLTATATSSSEIRLTWDVGGCNETYIIERATSASGPWVEIGRVEP